MAALTGSRLLARRRPYTYVRCSSYESYKSNRSVSQTEAAMTRVDTRPLQTVTIKSRSKSANFCRFCSVIALAAIAAAVYFIFKRPIESLGDPSDQYTIKNIPKIYTRLEGVDPEERDVFQGFRTSFLPPEEIVLARSHSDRKREVFEGNVTSDIMIWESNRRRVTPTRVKRMSRFTLTSQDYE